MTAKSTTPEKTQSTWFIYLILCKSGALYTGISTDVPRRYAQHCKGTGAKYTRANPPIQLLGFAAAGNRSSASKLEHALKKLPAGEKQAFLLTLQQA